MAQSSGKRRVTIVGKYPPIQGGVSASVFWAAHEMARGSFDVQVVTNAEEVEGEFRVFARRPAVTNQDACLEDKVTIHTTSPLKRGSYVPWANPFTSKLLGLTLQAATSQDSDVIVGWYFEPYGLVAALAGSILNKPVVLRHAGSDLGRLSLHTDLNAAYSWMLKSAARILTSRGLEQRLWDLGASKDKVSFIGVPRLPECFVKPTGPLDVDFYADGFGTWASQTEIPAELVRAIQTNNGKTFHHDTPVICCYGKVGEAKGSCAMLSALDQVAQRGVEFTFVSVACGHTSKLTKYYRQCLASERLARCTWMLPPIPPWEIPSLLSISNIGLFLENKFPISFHSPKIPREILASGACLICSSEIIEKHPYRESFVDGKNVVIVEDPNAIDALATKIHRLLDDSVETAMIGKHGRYLSKFVESELPQKTPLYTFLESYSPS